MTSTPVVVPAAVPTEVPKPVAGLIFILGWGIGITLWSVAHLFTGAAAQGFAVDTGIVFASLGLAAPFLGTVPAFRSAAIVAIVAIIAFGLFGFAGAKVLVFTLRLLVPLLALLTPLNKLMAFRVFS